MIRILLLFILLFTFTKYSSQFKSDYAATYQMEYTYYDKSDNEQFILFMDTKNDKSFFTSSTNFSMDSLSQLNPTEMNPYGTDFTEIVLRDKSNFSVFDKAKDVKIAYQEKEELKWDILNNTKKTESGNSLQLAKTKAYGRTWYAWFSKDIPINAGPYKFRGLPGFIVSMYDEKKEIIFTLQQFKKKVRNITLPKIKAYKILPKKDFNKTRYKIQISDDGVVLFNNSKEKDEWFRGVIKRYSTLPLLDNQYPIK